MKKLVFEKGTSSSFFRLYFPWNYVRKLVCSIACKTASFPNIPYTKLVMSENLDNMIRSFVKPSREGSSLYSDICLYYTPCRSQGVSLKIDALLETRTTLPQLFGTLPRSHLIFQERHRLQEATICSMRHSTCRSYHISKEPPHRSLGATEAPGTTSYSGATYHTAKEPSNLF